MIVPNQKIKVKWNGHNRKHYESIGFIFTKYGDEFEVTINELPLNSKDEIEIICDVCGKHHFNQYRRKSKSKNHFCCKECESKFKLGSESHNKLEFDEVKNIVSSKTNGKCKLINYISTEINMDVQCKCGKIFSLLLSNFKTGKIYCNECLKDIRRIKRFEKIVKYIHANGNIVLSKSNEYIDNKTRLNILCKCGNVFKATFRQYKHCNKRQCNDCGYLVAGGSRNEIEKVYDLFLVREFIPLFSENDYKNVQTKLPFLCSEHMTEGIQYITYASLVREETIGCKFCKNEILRDKYKENNPRQYFINKGFIPLFKNDEYINSSQQLPFICKKHKSQGIQTANLNVIKHNKGCKYCSNSKSKGEIKIKHFLDKFNIRYSMEDGFTDCRDQLQLKFDFLIFNESKLKLIIEYDGIQHFEPQDFAGKGKDWAKINFIENKRHDQIKNDYCLNNNISLIRIPYWDFDSIETILINVFGYFNLIKIDHDKDIVFNYLVNEDINKKVVVI